MFLRKQAQQTCTPLGRERGDVVPKHADGSLLRLADAAYKLEQR